VRTRGRGCRLSLATAEATLAALRAPYSTNLQPGDLVLGRPGLVRQQALAGFGVEQQHLARVELQLQGLPHLRRIVRGHAAADLGLVELDEHQGVRSGGLDDLDLGAYRRLVAALGRGQEDLLGTNAEDHLAIL